MPGSLTHRADVSVVVVADGPEPGLPASVRSLLASLDDAARGATGGLRGDHLGGEVVLVVRDVAALPCEVRAAGPRVRVVAAPGVTGGRARNVGVAAARGRYLLFTAPGARVPAGWVAALVAPLRAGHADLVAGAVHPPAGAPPAGPASAVLGLVPDPPPPGVLTGASVGATRAVLEAVGFDEALGTARYPGVAGVFRLDAVGAGFREHGVAGVPVALPDDPRSVGGRALAARARGHGRTAAYVERHLRDRRHAAAATVLRLLRDGAALAGARAGRAPLDRLLPARAALARDLRLLALLRAPDRERPRSAAGDAPGGAGAPRAAEPAALVARGAPPPTPPPPTAAAALVPAAVAPGERGAVHEFWSPSRTRAAAARAAAAARGRGGLPPTG